MQFDSGQCSAGKSGHANPCQDYWYSYSIGELTGSAGLARGPHKFAQRGNVGPVSPDASHVHGQPKAFGSFHIDARVVEL